MMDRWTGKADDRGIHGDGPYEPSLGHLLRNLGDGAGRVLRGEVELAKAEFREKIDVYERNLTRMAIGGALLLGALMVLLTAANRGLTVLLNRFMALSMAVWVAPLILATVIALVGWLMVRNARSEMTREGLAPEKTIRTLREEKDWAKDRMEEVRHG